MTQRIITIAMLFLGVCTASKSQDSIAVTYFKTTSLVFQYPIVNVDRGSEDLLAQKVKGTENTLLIKAARKGFPETNLTVITGDGKLHHFYITYCEKPRSQTFAIDSTENRIMFLDRINTREFENKSSWILELSGRGKSAKHSKFKVKFELNGIYIDGNVIFYDLEIRNKSNVDYDVQSLRFFIRDIKRPKRTASQENEPQPLFVSSKNSKVKGKSTLRVVYALEKFTIPDAKTLHIELFEKNGGRNLKLRIDNRTIVNAEKLPIK